MDHRKWTEEHVNALQKAIDTLHVEQFPLVILKLIELYIPEIRTINKPTELESYVIHKYDALKIAKGGILTVEPWNPNYNPKGGILRLHCNTLILESGGSIDVSGKGYHGGEKGERQGYSYNYTSDKIEPKQSKTPNCGGGGGGSRCGAGGGYGTKGKDARICGEGGGNTYGNKKVLIPINKNGSNMRSSNH